MNEWMWLECKNEERKNRVDNSLNQKRKQILKT